MSRFKFRAWDVRKERYLNTDNVFVDADGVCYHFDAMCKRFVLMQYDVIIEQCTGLKDKNGTLIYEGDVFEATVLNSFDGDHLIGKRIRGQVSFFTDAASFAFAAYSPCNLGEIEIIGNIHEMELEK